MTTPQPELSRLDALLMRVLDGEASDDERAELLALADADARLAEATALRQALRAAVLDGVGDPIDVVPQVMMALGLDDGWDAVSESLQATLVDESLSIDVSAAVMAAIAPEPEEADREAIELSALHDGELSAERRMALAAKLGAERALIDELTAHADLGRHLREAVAAELRHADLDSVWAGVAPAIGLTDPEAVPGWDASAAVLREAVEARATLSEPAAARMVDDIMSALPVSRIDEPIALEIESEPEELEAARGWFGLPFGTLLAVVAALLLVVPLVYEPDTASTTPSTPSAPAAPAEEVAEVHEVDGDEAFELVPMDEPEPGVVIESLEFAEDVIVQVIPGEEAGDATVLWIAEPLDEEEGATL